MNWGSDGFSDGFCQKRREGRLKALTGKWNGRVCYRLIAGWGYPKSRLPPVVYRVFPLNSSHPGFQQDSASLTQGHFFGAVTPQLERFLVDRSCWLCLLPQGRPCSFYPGRERGPVPSDRIILAQQHWHYPC